MGYDRAGNWQPSKEQMRHDAEEAQKAFLEQGKTIERLPTHSRAYGDQHFREAAAAYKAKVDEVVAKRPSLNPQEEVKRLAETKEHFHRRTDLIERIDAGDLDSMLNARAK